MKTVWFCSVCIGKMIDRLEDYERLIVKRIPRNGTECRICYNPANYPLNLEIPEVRQLAISLQKEVP